MKLIGENIGKTFYDINCPNVFLGQSPKAIEMKTKINPWDRIKLTSFCTAKETIKNNNNKKTIFGMGESSFKQCNRQGPNLQNIQITHTTQQQKTKQPN